MKTKLAWTIALVDIASVVWVIFYVTQRVFPVPGVIILVFLLPISFSLHVLEEFFFPGGYADWYKIYNPRFAGALNSDYLFRINAYPLFASMLVCLGAFDYRGSFSFFGIRAWLAFLCLLAANAIFHIQGAFRTKRYSPGVGVGLALYLPLAVFSFTYFLRLGVIDIFSAIICIALGALFQPALDYIKKRNLKRAGQIV